MLSPTAHLDSFARDNLPPAALWPMLRFDLPEDAQSVELKELLATSSAEEATSHLTGLDASHPLYAHVVRVVERVQKS